MVVNGLIGNRKSTKEKSLQWNQKVYVFRYLNTNGVEGPAPGFRKNMDPAEGDTEIDQIKVSWTGYARGRISEYNGQYEEEEEGLISPKRFLKVVGRQDTNVVIRTVEEANAVYSELGSYDSGQRTWMDHNMDRSIERVKRKIAEAMEERGYEATWGKRIYGIRSFKGFEEN